MKNKIKCPKCGHEAECSGGVSCWCDRDFCFGQRCRANELYSKYKCSYCGSEGTPIETQQYYEYHTPD